MRRKFLYIEDVYKRQGNCKEGVCVTVDGNLFSVTPETTEEFFEKEIKAKA